MRIKVGNNIPITDDTRAYAEFRFFIAVARQAALVRSVDVVIRGDSAVNHQFLCTVRVDLGSHCIKTQARAVYPNASINRAAERTAWLLARRRNLTDFDVKSSPFSRKRSS